MTARVESGQEVLSHHRSDRVDIGISRVGSGRVGSDRVWRFSNITGQIGSGGFQISSGYDPRATGHVMGLAALNRDLVSAGRTRRSGRRIQHIETVLLPIRGPPAGADTLFWSYSCVLKRRQMHVFVSRSTHTQYTQATHHCGVQPHRLNRFRISGPRVGSTGQPRRLEEKMTRPDPTRPDPTREV